VAQLPTLSFEVPTLGPAPAATSGTDQCNGPMSPSPEGPLMSVKISNQTAGSVVLSLYLQKTVFGECGYRSYNLDAHGSQVATGLPQGCYFAGAFVQDPKNKSKSFGSNLCMTNGDRFNLSVGADVIKLQ
jgi:hypothetical protein